MTTATTSCMEGYLSSLFNHKSSVLILSRQANKDGSVTADFDVSTKWGDDDQSVFAVTIVDIPNKDLLVK